MAMVRCTHAQPVQRDLVSNNQPSSMKEAVTSYTHTHGRQPKQMDYLRNKHGMLPGFGVMDK